MGVGMYVGEHVLVWKCVLNIQSKKQRVLLSISIILSHSSHSSNTCVYCFGVLDNCHIGQEAAMHWSSAVRHWGSNTLQW